MLQRIFFILLATILFSGCASVPMESKEASDRAKLFPPPSPGKSGLYIYRDSNLGGALKKDIWVNGKCIGESAPKVFFYEEVLSNQAHKITTESEFSPNELFLTTDKDTNYFIRQYIKLGVFVGGANLEIVNDAIGKEAIRSLELARQGNCSR